MGLTVICYDLLLALPYTMLSIYGKGKIACSFLAEADTFASRCIIVGKTGWAVRREKTAVEMLVRKNNQRDAQYSRRVSILAQSRGGECVLLNVGCLRGPKLSWWWGLLLLPARQPARQEATNKKCSTRRRSSHCPCPRTIQHSLRP